MRFFVKLFVFFLLICVNSQSSGTENTPYDSLELPDVKKFSIIGFNVDNEMNAIIVDQSSIERDRIFDEAPILEEYNTGFLLVGGFESTLHHLYEVITLDNGKVVNDDQKELCSDSFPQKITQVSLLGKNPKQLGVTKENHQEILQKGFGISPDGLLEEFQNNGQCVCIL